MQPLRLTALSIICLSASASAAELHVAPAPKGSDTASGTSAAPFATIGKAAERAAPGDVVVVHDGTYRETVRPALSGTAAQPIVFRVAEGARAIVSGTEVVAGPWQSEGGGVYSAAVTGSFASIWNQANQVFCNGQMLIEARWPNTSLDALSRPIKATVDADAGKTPIADGADDGMLERRFDDAELAAQTNGFWVGATIYMQPSSEAWGWTTTGQVTGHDGARLTFRTWNHGGNDGDAEGRLAVGARYYLFGKREFLDANGEWLLEGGRLYLRTPDGSSPEGKLIELKRRDLAFDLDSRSHITVQGFDIFGATISTDNAAGDGKRGYAWRRDINPASHHVVIDSVRVLYPSHFTDMSGHMMGQWGQNTGIVLSGSDGEVRNSVVRFSAGNGISALGARHRIHNNLLQDTNYNSVECACIASGWATPSPDQEWSHNTCQRTGRSGLQLRTFHNSTEQDRVARVHHNAITEYLLQDFDGGAFYTFGSDGKFARIDHNLFVPGEPGPMRFGAYWDYSKNFVLDHNVIYNAYVAIQLTGSYPADNPSGQSSMLIHSNTAIGEGPWSRAIGGWSHAIGGSTLGGSVIVNNVFNVAVFEQANGDKVNHWPDYGQAAVTTHNLVFGREAGGHNSDIAANVDADDRYEESAGFVDGNARDYRLLADSVAVDTGSTASQFTLDGMLLDAPLDPIVGSGPDRGALERGGDGWFKTIGASIADASGGSNSSGGNGGANATGGANGNTSGIAGTNTGASAGNAGAEAGPASEADTADCACRTPGTRRTRPVLPWLAAALVAAASLRRRRRALALPQGTR